MLANIASIEIPPICETYLEWIKRRPAESLAKYGVDPASATDRDFFPRLMLGEYFRDQFIYLEERAPVAGIELTTYEACAVTDIKLTEGRLELVAQCPNDSQSYDRVVIATGHV